MSALYLSEHEKAALPAVDLRKLEELADDALVGDECDGGPVISL
jgi:hypothetical protein